MKKILLLFLLIGTSCIAKESEELPEKLWKDLIELSSYQGRPMMRWKTDILVRLEGDYTKNDSVNISKVLKKLDSLTESISINFSKLQEPNFRIVFLDTSITSRPGKQNIWRLEHGPKNGFKRGELNIYKNKKNDESIVCLFESRIAKLLMTSYFYDSDQKRNSIFNPQYEYNNAKVSLNDRDKSILSEIYKIGFEERLEKAKAEFGFALRDRSLWWVKNPIAVILLPVLFLVLFFLFVIDKIKAYLSFTIKNDKLHFSILSMVVLLFADILIIFSVSTYDFLTISNSFGFSIVRLDTVLTTTTCLVFLFPFLYLFRFVELKIQKSSQNIFVKTAFIFLSTGFLPFIIVLIFFQLVVFSGKVNNVEYVYFTLSKIFLGIMAVASLRALIGYFIFKERSLIIENETKLSNLRELNTKAELKSLQAQINPHFLYNSLNSIASLALVDGEKTQKMAYSLSDLFKYSINRQGKNMSTISEEVEIVETYLEIEKIRFGDRLGFLIEVDEEIKNKKIPLFLMQPLVENAFKHGVSKNEGKGEICLKITNERNAILIMVSDNGPDFPEGLVSGHGLQTVYDLLRLSYGDKAKLNWTNTPKKMIKITLPQTR